MKHPDGTEVAPGKWAAAAAALINERELDLWSVFLMVATIADRMGGSCEISSARCVLKIKRKPRAKKVKVRP